MAESDVENDPDDGKCCHNNDNVSAKTQTSPTLPEHLILDYILPRLPVKTLIRFKSVSKFWFSTISSPKFAKYHLKMSSIFSPNQLIMLTERSSKFIVLPYDELNNLKDPVMIDFNLDSCVELLENTCIEFVGCCNGLVCLYIYSDEGNAATDFFCICNPALHQCSKVDVPSLDDACPAVFWFGCTQSSIDDHKIVACFPSTNHHQSIYIFSLRTGKWKKVCDFGARCIDYHNWGHETMPLNDILYWCLQYEHTVDRPKCVVGFDLVNEQLKEVPRIDWLDGYVCANFYVLDGCLALHCYKGSFSDIWILKQHDDWSSWEKSFTLSLGHLSLHNITPRGNFLVWDYYQDYCKIIDPTKNNQEQPQVDVYYSNAPMVFGAGDYGESLISPFGTIKFTSIKDEEV